MKILLKEPEEIKNLVCRQFVIDQMVDVDLDEIAEAWSANVQRDREFKTFTEYLKEQLEAKK